MDAFKKTHKLFSLNPLGIIILILAYLIPTLCFFFEDPHSIFRQGINVWYALFQGRFLEYYSFNLESMQKGEMIDPANYEMFLNILIGIWQLPLYIAEQICGKDILDNMGARVWGSLLAVVFSFLSGWQLRKLGRKVGISGLRLEWLYFTYMTGTILLTSTCTVGQIDVIGTFFLLLAVRHLIDKDDIRFLIYASISVQCKSFAVFIILPLVLLTQKNVIKAAVYTVIPVAVTWLIGLPFSIADPAGVMSKHPRLWFLVDSMTRTRIELMGIEVPVLFIALGIVVMSSYYVRAEEQRTEWILYYAFAGMLPMLLCMRSYPQWMLYMYPLALLMIFRKEHGLGRRIFYETAGTLSLTVGFLVSYSSIFNENNMRGMLVDILAPGLLGTDVLEGLSQHLLQEKYFQFWTLSYAAFFVWIIGVSVFYCPFVLRLREGKEKNVNEWSDKQISIWLYLRATAGIVICNAALFLLIV